MHIKTFPAIMVSVTGFLLAACTPLSTPIQPPVASAPIAGPFVPVGEPEIKDLGPTTEVVWNCGSGGGTVIKNPSMSVATGHAVEWEVGGITGVGLTIGEGAIPGGVELSGSLEGRYATQFEQGVQQGTGWNLPAEPNTSVIYTIMWREIWQRGYVNVTLADQSVVRVNVRFRTGFQSEIVGKQVQSCDGTQQPTDAAPQVTQRPTTPPVSSDVTTYCYGQCWQYDENTRTMTWTGPTDGREDIWQGDDLSLSRIRSGWTAIFGPVSVPGEIEACVLTLNGQTVVNSCDDVQHPYPVEANKSYQVTSAHSEVGGFRWKPAKGYGYRAP